MIAHEIGIIDLYTTGIGVGVSNGLLECRIEDIAGEEI